MIEPTGILIAKIGLPYMGFLAVTMTDIINIPELVGGVSVGALLFATVRLSLAQGKSLLADQRDLIDELKEENQRLRAIMKDKESGDKT